MFPNHYYPQNGSISVQSSSYQMRLEKALFDFNSNQEKRKLMPPRALSSLIQSRKWRHLERTRLCKTDGSFHGFQSEFPRDQARNSLNVFQKDPSPQRRNLLPDSLSPNNSIGRLQLSNGHRPEFHNIMENLIRAWTHFKRGKQTYYKKSLIMHRPLLQETPWPPEHGINQSCEMEELRKKESKARNEEVKEQGKEEDEMETNMEVKELTKEEESEFETDEEVEEILEEEEEDEDDEKFNSFQTMKE
ncbi:hypothetical protein Tco_0695780 [Tanacetum coccineum]